MEHTTHRIVIGAAVALMAGMVYVNALRNPFVYDDYHTVVANPSLDRVSNLPAIIVYDMSRPLANFSFAVDRTIWGRRPLGFHVTNVLLHMLNAVLLFHLAWRHTASGVAAASAAALFAVHPMMTEAVGYITGRSEVLCATWFLAAMLCGRRWLNDGGRRWAALTIGFWLAGLATKETAAMFPFVFLVYDMLQGTRPAGQKGPRYVLHASLIGITVLAGIVRLAVLAREYPGAVVPHWRFLLLDLDVVARYVLLIVRPVRQTIFHVVSLTGPFGPRALVAYAIVGGLLATAWRLRRAAPAVTLGLCWFFLLLVPSSVLILLDQGEPMVERRVYLASAGLFLAIGCGLAAIASWLHHVRPAMRPFAAAALLLVIASFSVNTIARNAVWSSPVTLWRESVDLAPAHYRPRLLLGEALQDAGRRREAMEEFQTAIRLRPTEPIGYVKLGRCHVELGEFAQGRRLFLKALELDPQNTPARQSLISLDKVESIFKPDGARP